MTKQETQKYTIDLAVLLYLDLPFWKRWLIRRKFAERTVTPQGWKDCLQMAYYNIGSLNPNRFVEKNHSAERQIMYSALRRSKNNGNER